MDETKKFPVVMRMQGLWPKDLGGFEAHRCRRGGDLGHIDQARSKLNRPLIGDDEWAAKAQAEVLDMAQENFATELEGLKRRRRKADLRKRLTEGPRDPWRATRHGPMREIILTANQKWFEKDGEAMEDGSMSIEQMFGEDRIELFEERALAWLQEHFGDDVIHARADLDETTYHIHAVILPRARDKDGRRMLQPSKHPMIRDYEAAQDSVGAWFSGIGLTRGEKRAEKRRNAIRHNETLRQDQAQGQREEEIPDSVPEKRRHVSPRDWRREQEEKLARQESALQAREAEVTEKQRDAEDVLAVAAKIAAGDTTAVEAQPLDSPGMTRARSLFARALVRLRHAARQEAQQRVKTALEQLRTADAAIVRMAKQLPRQAREDIAKTRPGLARTLGKLGDIVGGAAGRKRGRDDEER